MRPNMNTGQKYGSLDFGGDFLFTSGKKRATRKAL